jgi:hypothetical protein
MTHAFVRLLLAFAFVLVPVSAGIGATAAARPLALTAAPARLAFRGGGDATVRIRNTGTKRVVVEAALAGFALDLRGRPHVVARRRARSAAPWLRLRPARFTLAPHSVAHLHVTARLPRHVEPGDHDALVLLSTRPIERARVAVRLRVGVVVLVRAPGTVVRRVRLGRLRVVRRRGKRTLELIVANAGNVTERLRVHAVLSRLSTRRHVMTAVAAPRDLHARTRGLFEFRLRTPEHVAVIARVVIPAAPGRPVVRRAYHLRL